VSQDTNVRLPIGAILSRTLSDPSLRLKMTGHRVLFLIDTVRLGRITHH
jgi:hypothetical protein